MSFVIITGFYFSSGCDYYYWLNLCQVKSKETIKNSFTSNMFKKKAFLCARRRPENYEENLWR